MKYYLFVIFIFSFYLGQSQYYVTGQERAEISWNQLKTKNFRIVYPNYADSLAQNLAKNLNWAYLNSTEDIHHKPKKFDILLHTESATSNGMVAWAPKRMEIYSTFPQDIYAQNWLEQLAIHEFRHIVQLDKLNQGFTKALSFATGQQAVGAVLGLYIPTWLLEGDAIWAETVYSSSGRGRENIFIEPLKSQILNKGIYSYDKASLGSYRDFVPNEYELGYNLVAQIKSEFGDDIFSKVIDNVARKPFTIVPFSRGMKKNTGFTKVKLYKHSMQKLDSLWRINANYYPENKQNEIVNPVVESFTNYKFPHFINDSILFVVKSGIDDIPRFVEINVKTHAEKIKLTPGFSNFYHVGFTKNLIIWSQLDYDARWTHRKYWNIYSYDLHTYKLKQLTKNKICFAPEISSDESKIVFVETDAENNFYIKIIETLTGIEINSFKLNEYPITPVWSEDEKEIYFVRLYNKIGQSIASLNIESGEIIDIIAPDFFTKSSVNVSGDFLYFQCAYDGVNNAYTKNLKNGKIYQISNFATSISDMSLNIDGSLLYSYYTSNGYRIASLDSQLFTWTPLEKIVNRFPEIFKINNSKNYPNIQKDSLHFQNIEPKKYSKIGHLFNIHSWFPAQFDVGNFQLNPAIKLLSQNLLGTAVTSAGYTYYRNSSGEKYFLDFSYKGFYPVIGGGIEYLKTPIIDSLGQRLADVNKDLTAYLYISQPINFSKGKYFRFFEPSITSNIILSTRNLGVYYFPLNFRIYAHHIIHSSYRDLRPKWGQSIDINYLTSTEGAKFSNISHNGNQFSITSIFYFPGIVNHHSLRIYLAAQQHSKFMIGYSDRISFPRGYIGINALNFYSTKIDYAFPIIYPDLSLSSVAYIKRIKANIFSDYGIGYGNTNKPNYFSFGADLTADIHFLRFIAPAEIGIRTLYMPDIKSLKFELLFGVDFNSL
ncbi:MAG: hypothetical protein AUJ98_06960 [Bacteroidetes bacterium CG2_30_33_31]|nr:MAG: hypothetical protein AUJ98_06960 [Bacteroidetes bacterium CG2_30_33_31]